jgi:phytoene dehydrogenase-like protein
MGVMGRRRRSGRAVVVGAGHNGLVAANLLADAGWQVLVLEASDRAGGAIRSDQTLLDGYVTDWFSAFYPMAAASPVLQSLHLERWGLSWRYAPAPLAHVFPDGRCALLGRAVEDTAASLESFAAGDGAAWIALTDQFKAVQQPLVDALLQPFPPVRAASTVLRRFGWAGSLRFARFAVLPVRRFGKETFSGEGAPMLLAGNALHTDLSPDAAGSALYGWLLCMLAQTAGFPVPAGGSSAIIAALEARLRDAGGELRLNAPVAGIEVAGERVSGLRLESGEVIATTTVLADVDALQLYLKLVGAQHLPGRLVDDLRNFEWDFATVKVNWALSGPIPWNAPGARQAGTVHLGVDLDGLTRYAASLATGRAPSEPFVVLGQMTTADASRSPQGSESAWAYSHLPHDAASDQASIDIQVDRIEAAVEAQAPGFRSRILRRVVQTPADLQGADRNLFGGALGAGTAAIHQELFFRPVPGLGRAETVIDGLYLASASAHPGGGVHGAPGANAARATLRRSAPGGAAWRAVIDAVHRRIYKA